MKEEIINWGKGKSFIGVLAGRMSQLHNYNLCVIFVNAGLIHKVGPNRIYVNSARELAKKGICSFRFDFSGHGDSKNSFRNKSIAEAKNDEIIQAMDAVQKKTGICRFILLGLCSGAKDAFTASFKDDRIIGLSLIDGIYQDNASLSQINSIAVSNCRIRYYKKNILSFKRWVKLASGKSKILSKGNIVSIFYFLIFRFKDFFKMKKTSKAMREEKSTLVLYNRYGVKDWEKLIQKKVRIQLIFCDGGTALDIFNLTIARFLRKIQDEYSPKIIFVKDVDHTFTPIWSQELLIDLISKWITEKSHYQTL